MSKQELLYLGDGPGQGEGVAIGGIKYERNKAYKFDADLAADLFRRGGWEIVKPERKPRGGTKQKGSESWHKH
jgi:hypothetical protein